MPKRQIERALSQNLTLGAVVDLCEREAQENAGVRCVVSYNYDNLFEMAPGQSVKPMWNSRQRVGAKLEMQQAVLGRLGVTPLWVDSAADVPELLERIRGPC